MRELIFNGQRHRVSICPRGLAVLLATLALGGCLDESTAPQSTTGVSPGVSTSAGTPASAAAQNLAPTIAGTPLHALNVANSYAFQPAASDAEGDALTFNIANKPSWASFNTATGQLSGTPSLADVGTHANITIAVTDGRQTTTLPTFSIAVTQMSAGAATLSWMPPTENTDGTPLTNLSGYRIYFGTSPAAITQSITLDNAGMTAYVMENLSPATWYFAITALANGIESERSAVVSKTIS